MKRPTPSPEIILVEDDVDLRESLMDCFAQSGFAAMAAGSALEFYRLLASHRCDIAILDLGLPDEDGLSIVRFLSEERPRTGIIILTARGTLPDRVSGFRTGADIYLVKPVEYAELEAAILSVRRRLEAQSRNRGDDADTDAWKFDSQTLQLIAPNAVSVALTGQECRLVGALLAAKGDSVSRADLLAALGYAHDRSSHSRLNAVLVRLRAKVVQATGLALPIQTVRGQGYLAHNLRDG